MVNKSKSEEEIYYAALKEPPNERPTYIKAACGGDLELLKRVESLLKIREAGNNFLESPPFIDQPLLNTLPEEKPGSNIDKYKLLEKIGEGGMAVVYMAEQEKPVRRKVALKIIKLGMDTKSVIARFEAERQALAVMDHPNIAKVFDGGATETGRPYFVMELVRGVSITEYCDKNKLDTFQRLKLFIQVCNAVQHAHQKGIIHRDIKPTNVLITHHDGIPMPKIIDFGIAKATNQRLTEKTFFTRYAQMIGTPAYMSPEQAELSDSDVDTRTDIYSLGVLLYELLTGSTPFGEERLHQVGYLEMQRIIKEEQPTKPSTKLNELKNTITEIAQSRKTGPESLKKLIKGDLDWIVMRCLEKDRTRRYNSTGELAAEIQRYINHEPVLAGPPSALYKIRKFVQRRRVLVMTSIIVIMAIIIGLVSSTMMYLRAEQARRQESVARAEAQTIIGFLTNDLLASVYPEKAKSQEVTVRYILETAATNLENRFANSPLAEASIRETLSLTYQKLGDYQAAEPHLQRALQIRQEQLGEDDPSTLSTFCQLGSLYTLQGKYEKAEAILKNVLDMRIRVFGEEYPDTLETMGNLAELYVYRANFNNAYPLFIKTIQIGNRVLGGEHPVVLKAMLGHTHLLIYSFQPGQAAPLASKGFEISRRVLGEEHETTLGFMNMLATVYKEQKNYDEAEKLFVRAYEISQRILGQEHPISINIMSCLGDLYRNEGQYEEAAPLVIKSTELGRRVLGWGHIWTLLSAMRLVRFYEVQEQYDEMEKTLIEALKNGCPKQGNHQLTGWFEWKFQEHTIALSSIARKYYNSGEYNDATKTLARKAELLRMLSPENSGSSLSDLALLVMSLHKLDRNREDIIQLNRLRKMFEQGEYTYEEQYLCEAEKIFSANDSEAYQAWNLIDTGELERALKIVEGLQSQIGNNEPNNIRSLRNSLARAYCLRGISAEGQGDYIQAIAYYESSLQINPDSARTHNQLVHLFSTCHIDKVRNSVIAIEKATQACKLTEWKNASCLTTLASAHAEAGDFSSAVKYQRQAMELISHNGYENSQEQYQMRLHLYESGKPYHQSIIARWTFEQSIDKVVLDTSGNELNGKLIGDAYIVEDLDRSGKVLCLDGESDWVDCGSDVRLNILSRISISCWIKVTKFNKSRHVIISKGGDAWSLARVVNANGVEFMCSGLSTPDNMYGAVYGKININDGQWHHVVGIYDGANIRLYIDGKLDVSYPASGKINANTSKVLIGENDYLRTKESQDRSFNGFLDDIYIFDYALSEYEIKDLYESRGNYYSEK